MANIFYARVSTAEQNEARQIQGAKEIDKDIKIFIDKASGKDAKRPALKEMLSYIREGDVVFCSDISRISRNTKDLLEIVERINKKNAEFVSLRENIDTRTDTGKFMLTVFGAMAELERKNILERQREGIEIAKAEGRYKGKQAQKIDESLFLEVCKKWHNDEITAVEAQKILNMPPRSFYRRAEERGLSKPGGKFKGHARPDPDPDGNR